MFPLLLKVPLGCAPVPEHNILCRDGFKGLFFFNSTFDGDVKFLRVVPRIRTSFFQSSNEEVNLTPPSQMRK